MEGDDTYMDFTVASGEESDERDLERIDVDVGFLADDINIIKSDVRELQEDINTLKNKAGCSPSGDECNEDEWEEWADEKDIAISDLKHKLRKIEARVVDIETFQRYEYMLTFLGAIYTGSMFLVGALITSSAPMRY